MNGCRACFGGSSPIELRVGAGQFGNCDFCQSASTEIWPTTTWADDFTRVIEIYRRATQGENGAVQLADRLQADWSIFSFSDPHLIQQFLSSVFEGQNSMIDDGELVVPDFDESGPNSDHSLAWQSFVTEITSVNRYFPAESLELGPLQAVIDSHLRTISAGTPLYRARVSEQSSARESFEMGSPPSSKARAGRANSSGIPALYVATEKDTALKECRAVQHTYVSVATFTVETPFTFLDLSKPEAQNPFTIEDDLLAALASGRYLSRLNSDLSRPTRGSDNLLEYIPTQYLCDYVKSLGIPAVRYKSAMSTTGANMVIFDETPLAINSTVEQFVITDVTLQYEPA